MAICIFCNQATLEPNTLINSCDAGKKSSEASEHKVNHEDDDHFDEFLQGMFPWQLADLQSYNMFSIPPTQNPSWRKQDLLCESEITEYTKLSNYPC